MKHYITLLFGLLFLTVLFFILEDHYMRMMTFIALFVLTLTGHIIFLGYTGQILLCHASLMAFGGYTTAILSLRLGVPTAVGVLSGLLLAILFAFLLGKVILRLRKLYLAVGTLAIALITDTVLECWRDFTGGQTGIIGVPCLSFGGFSFESLESFYILAWILALTGWLMVLHLDYSRVGRALKVISRDEEAAGALGIDVPGYKVLALMLTAAYASLSGALYVHYIGMALPSTFNMVISFEVLMAVILGGIGTPYGVFLAAPLLKFLPEMTNAAGDYKPIIFGLLFIVIPMYFRGGIAGLLIFIWRKIGNVLLKK